MAEEGCPPILLRALKASAKVLDTNLLENLEHELANGQLLLKLLDKHDHVTTTTVPLDEDMIWTKIKDRLEEVFGPSLINWDIARVYSHQSRTFSSERRLTLGGRQIKSAVALSAKVQNEHRRESLCPQPKSVDTSIQSLNETYSISERHGCTNLYPDNYNKEQLGVALLALFVCCVFDQNKDVYSALYQLDERTQQRIQAVFQHLLGL